MNPPRFAPGDLLSEPNMRSVLVDVVLASGGSDELYGAWSDTLEAYRGMFFLGLGDRHMQDVYVAWRHEH